MSNILYFTLITNNILDTNTFPCNNIFMICIIFDLWLLIYFYKSKELKIIIVAN